VAGGCVSDCYFGQQVCVVAGLWLDVAWLVSRLVSGVVAAAEG